MASKSVFILTSPRPSTALIQRPFASISSSSTRAHSFQFSGRQLCVRRRLVVLPFKATADQQGKVHLFIIGFNWIEYIYFVRVS